MKKSGTLISIAVLLVLWQTSALYIQNTFLMPYPMDVVSVMFSQLKDAHFYNIVFHTIYRSLCGLVLAFVTAGSCALLAFFFAFFKHLLAPIILLTKSVPNIAYIIIILVWFGSESSAIIIPFLILFPVIYANVYEGLQAMDQDLKDVLKIYPEKRWTVLCKVYLPMLVPTLNASLSSGLGLAFKVGVMAEIIGQVQVGMGRQLNVARFNMDMTTIFAWTFWIIIILVILEGIRKIMMYKIKKIEDA